MKQEVQLEQKIWKLDQNSEEYPERLREIPYPPKGLYVLGRLPDERIPSVAIIGARDCSEYGRYVATCLGELMGREGIQVISGMARGIDGIGQKAALEAGGSSFGVLGNGVDICYPKANRDLYEELIKKGGLLSEYEPGTPARPQNFPARNRIVSGLADVVVVVEARMKSGTLITVDMALEQGREVYVVPGRITDRLSDGCNNLVKLGAGVILNGKDFVEDVRDIFARKKEAGIGESKRESKHFDIKQYRNGTESKTEEMLKPNKPHQSGKSHGLDEPKDTVAGKLPLPLQRLYDVLDFMPKSVEELKREIQSEEEDKQIITHLMRLCMENMAVQVSPGYFCRVEK